jgi:aldehyde dehydrogenase (NAD+)
MQPRPASNETLSADHARVGALLSRLGVGEDPRVSLTARDGDQWLRDENPTTGQALAWVRLDDAEAYERAASASVAAFDRWRRVPAPQRGQVVRAIGEAFRRHQDDLATLVSLEVGKIRAEGRGEIQEIVDIADFAVGLSRQLPGRVFPSERADHRMFEQWLPLGPVGVISAFNFPAAVWGWNAMLAAVCGDSVLWKPSLLAPLTAIACNALAERVARELGHEGVFGLVIGRDEVVGERLTADRRVPLVSATGSCAMGRRVGAVVAQRLGRSLLELGGNNACIVHKDADLGVALPAIVFGAVGTAGQRCTTTRRLIVHESIAGDVIERLRGAYEQVNTRVGDPLADGTLVGPLISTGAVQGFARAVEAAQSQGGRVVVGGEVARGVAGGAARGVAGGHFVLPTVVEVPSSNALAIARVETFAPILYVFRFREIDEAIAINNDADQGLSSAVFSESARVQERFLNPDGTGSDCGLAYVNLGTSGAEIGGAFGGEKETGGGRESGSDSWRAYMRRQTCTINFSGRITLAQGITFG